MKLEYSVIDPRNVDAEIQKNMDGCGVKVKTKVAVLVIGRRGKKISSFAYHPVQSAPLGGYLIAHLKAERAAFAALQRAFDSEYFKIVNKADI